MLQKDGICHNVTFIVSVFPNCIYKHFAKIGSEAYAIICHYIAKIVLPQAAPWEPSGTP
jgi:hypothetical protein